MPTPRILTAGLLCLAGCCRMLSAAEGAAAKKYPPMTKSSDAKFNDWLARWQKNIIADARNRYCDKALGEDIGWLMTPFMDGFYYGYMATKDPKWVDMLVDWTDSWVKRAVQEPDGCFGWPRREAAGTKVDNLDDFNADSMLGEAMVLRPAVLLAARNPQDSGSQARSTAPRPKATSSSRNRSTRNGTSAAAGVKPRTAA